MHHVWTIGRHRQTRATCISGLRPQRGLYTEEPHAYNIYDGSKGAEIRGTHLVASVSDPVELCLVETKGSNGINRIRGAITIDASLELSIEEWQNSEELHCMSPATIAKYLENREKARICKWNRSTTGLPYVHKPFRPHAWMICNVTVYARPMFHRHKRGQQVIVKLQLVYVI